MGLGGCRLELFHPLFHSDAVQIWSGLIASMSLRPASWRGRAMKRPGALVGKIVGGAGRPDAGIL